MRIDPLPWIAFVLTVAGTAVSLWISQHLGLIEQCRVFIDGCTSISAAGRQPPAIYIFRPAMISTGVLLMLIWWATAIWLRGLGAGNRSLRTAVGLLGAISPVLLIVYVTLLGADGDLVKEIRQWSIYTYFPAALLAKILTAGMLLRLPGKSSSGVPGWLAATMLALAAVLLLVAVASVLIEQLMTDPSAVHNLMQWHASAAFAAWYPLLWLAWKSAGNGPAARLRAD